jgi:hypothetical protein
MKIGHSFNEFREVMFAYAIAFVITLVASFALAAAAASIASGGR